MTNTKANERRNNFGKVQSGSGGQNFNLGSTGRKGQVTSLQIAQNHSSTVNETIAVSETWALTVAEGILEQADGVVQSPHSFLT